MLIPALFASLPQCEQLVLFVSVGIQHAIEQSLKLHC